MPVIGLGLSIPTVAIRNKRAVAYTFANTEAAALVSRMAVVPLYSRCALIDQLVGDLKTGGVWTKLDVLYLFAAHNSQAARLNWIGDGYNASVVASPTFTIDRGYRGDGAASHIDSGYNPATAVSPRFVLNDAYFGYWSRTVEFVAGGSVAGYYSSGGTTILPHSALGDHGCRVNQSTPSNGSVGIVPDGSGLFSTYRTGASAVGLSRNGVQLITMTTASESITNGTLRFGCIGAISFNTTEFAAGMIGSALTPTQDAAAYTAINNYLTAIAAA